MTTEQAARIIAVLENIRDIMISQQNMSSTQPQHTYHWHQQVNSQALAAQVPTMCQSWQGIPSIYPSAK